MEHLHLVRNELIAPKLVTLTDDEQYDSLIDVWSQVKLLTGAIMYPAKDAKGNPNQMAEFQLEVIRRFLATSRQFSSLTPAEVIHAFYLNAQGELDKVYRHYNKELNAEFVGDVLLAYLKYKRELYQRAGADIKALLDPPLNVVRERVVILEGEWQSYIQQDYDRYRSGKQDWIFGIPAKYAYLRSIGVIQLSSRAHWSHLYRLAMRRRWLFGRKIPAPGENRDAIIQARRIYEVFEAEGWIPAEEQPRIVANLRQHAYLYFFECLQACAINNIFSEIQYNELRHL